MPTKDTFDILDLMMNIGLILLIVGFGLQQEATHTSIMALVSETDPTENKTQEAPTLDQVETEADLWLEPKKKAQRKKRTELPKKMDQSKDRMGNWEERQLRKKRPQDPNNLGDSQGTVEQVRRGIEKNKIIKINQKALPKNTSMIEEPAVGNQNILPPSGTMTELVSYWQQRRKHLNQHDYDLAQRDLKLFLELKGDLGIRNAFLEANVLLLEAKRARQANNHDRAEQLILSAKEMAPDLASVYVAQASLWFSESHFRLGRIFSMLVESVAAGTRDPLSSNRLWTNWLIGLLLGLGLSSVVIVGLQFVRISKLYFHDFHHLFPKGATYLQTTILAAIVILLPILFRLGLVVTLFSWVLIIWLYQTRREKMVIFLVVISFTLMPLALQKVVSGLLLPGSKIPDLLNVSQGSASQTSLKRITEWIKEEPNNPVALSVMGDYHKRVGQLQTAKEYLEKASNLRPNSAVLANNLGNVLFLLGQVNQAIRQYDRATKLRTDLAIPYYNLSRAYYRQMDLNKGKQYHSQAYRLDSEMVRVLSEKTKSRKINDVLADLPIPQAWLFDSDYLNQKSGKWSEGATYLWKTWGGTGSAENFPLIGGGLMIVLGLALVARRRLWLSSACVRCGRPACRRCNAELHDDLVCGQCFHAFVQKDRVDAKSKISKEIQIRQYLRRRETIARAITFLIPGAGQFIKERPLKGTLFLMVFSLAVVQILLGSGVLRDCRNLVINPDWLLLIPLLSLLLTFYVWAIMDVFRIEA